MKRTLFLWLALTGCGTAELSDGWEWEHDEAELAAPPKPKPIHFEYGFIGGTNEVTEDVGVSSWTEVSFGCHYKDAAGLEAAIAAIPKNLILLEFGRAWKANGIGCGMNSDGESWGNVATFKNRIEPLLSVIEAHKDRVFASYVFDEPDVGHGGPNSGELQKGIAFMKSKFPDLPAYVNWFDPGKVGATPNSSWNSATKGASPGALSARGKPMFLWWFNNEGQPSASTVLGRWNTFVGYHFSHQGAPLIALGWCCDAIERRNSKWDTNSKALYALLENVGRAEHEFRENAPAAFALPSSGGFISLFREGDNSLTFMNGKNFPTHERLPIGGESPYFPSLLQRGDTTHIVVTGTDGRIYLAKKKGADWTPWTAEPNFTQGASRPAILGHDGVFWVAVRDAQKNLWAHRIGTAEWKNLGPIESLPLIRRSEQGQFYVRAFFADGRVYRRPLIEGDVSGPEAWKYAR